jgi:hypothetical protein
MTVRARFTSFLGSAGTVVPPVLFGEIAQRLKCIRDKSFGDLFNDGAQIRKHWPI